VVQGGKDESEGIKTDGTLWVSTNSLPHGRLPQFGQIMTPITSGNWVQFGADTNWYNLWAIGVHVVLAKTDGTLWRWGPQTWTNKLHEWPGLRAFTPERSNGSLWAQSANRDREHQDNFGERFNHTLGVSPQNGQWRGTAALPRNCNLGVLSDGTFRIWAFQKLKKIKKGNEYAWFWTETDSQIGKDTNWLALASCHNKVVTLKNDGTLWLWNFLHEDLMATTPVLLSIHSDWISVVSAGNGVISLAADGSLWYWPLDDPDHFGPATAMVGYRNDDPNREPLLKMSGKPQFLGNIFGGNN
jgi:alpha-tubulin suppressor-like RCC1 family protein